MQEIITYLEMTDPAAFRAPQRVVPAFDFRRSTPHDPELHRSFYRSVGEAWYWIDRSDWQLADWAEHGNRPGIELWTAWVADQTIGFVELARRSVGEGACEVEIAYFGLLPAWIGQGYGSALLGRAVQTAWQGNTRRVWLHTCNFDHPTALANYRARGFEIYDVQTIE